MELEKGVGLVKVVQRTSETVLVVLGSLLNVRIGWPDFSGKTTF